MAIPSGGRWLLHAGDVYYGVRELDVARPSLALRGFRRLIHVDPTAAEASLEAVRALRARAGGEVGVFGSHDPTEPIPDLSSSSR